MPDSMNVAHMIWQTGLPLPQVAELTRCSLSTVQRWDRGESRPQQLAFARLRKFIEEVRQLDPHPRIDLPSPRIATPRSGSFTFVDLFAGIGGFRMAFEKVGGQCVFTSELDSACRETYKANFSMDHHAFEGDIRRISEDQIPPHDILLAGFPCQPFSIAGVSKRNALGQRHGLACDDQGAMFREVRRIIKACRPKAFLLENVKNLLNHDKGKTYKRMLQFLQKELGYHVTHKVINAHHFVPQNRERIFIAGFRGKNGFDLEQEVQLPGPAEGPNLSMVLHPEDGTEEVEDRYTQGPKAQVDPRYTLSKHLWDYLRDYADRHRKRGNGFGYGLVGRKDVARTLSARYFKDGAEILVRQRGRRPRRLTPRECARLMGFERIGGKRFEIPVSDTQAYRQFGNAVVVPVAEAVAKAMHPYLRKSKSTTHRNSTRRAVSLD